ncbi:MAG TPA: hypothetical protein VGL77_10375 [Armatimonadota bacterium]|jgi:hypothetical protein
MADERLREIAEQVTSGLSDDPELRLDVQAEVLSHLKDTARVVAEEGKSDDEAADFAARTFGSPVELADGLREANRPRMKTRALLRLAARALLIPASVLLAVFLGCGGLVRTGQIANMVTAPYEFQVVDHLPKLPILELPSTRQRRVAREAALQRMRGRAENTDNLRALWVAHQRDADAAMYFAHYVTFLWPKADVPPRPSYDWDTGKLLPEPKESRHKTPHYRDPAFEREMRLGMQIDPTNALYHYKLAAYFLNRGIDAQEEHPNPPGVPKYDYLYNQQFLEMGLREFRAGLRLPTCRYYTTAVIARKLALLPSPRYSEDYLQRLFVVCDIFIPSLGESCNMARKVAGGMRVLVAQGRQHEVEPLLHAWKTLGVQLVDGADVEMHLQAAVSETKTLGQATAAIYRQLGQEAEAQRTLSELRQFIAPIEEREARSEQRSHTDQFGPMLMPIYAPRTAKGFYTSDDLMPLWMHQRVVLEEGIVAALMVLLTLIMLWTALCGSVLLLRARGRTSPPLLLLPPARDTAKIVGYGVLLPLLVYEVYLHTPYLSGWAYGMTQVEFAWRMGSELLVMAGVLLFAPMLLATRYLRRRCLLLGMPLPDKYKWLGPLLCGVLILCWIGALIAGLWLAGMTDDGNAHLIAGVSLLICATFTAFWALRLLWRSLAPSGLKRLGAADLRPRAFIPRLIRIILAWAGWIALWYLALYHVDVEEFTLGVAMALITAAVVLSIPLISWSLAPLRQREKHTPVGLTFRGTMARSLVPVYALAIVLLAAFRPYLAYQEAKYLAQDRLIFVREKADGFTPLEGRLVRTFKREMLRQAEAMHFGEAGR